MSPSVARYGLNLQKLQIGNCPSMEELITKENSSLGLCQCEHDACKNLQKGHGTQSCPLTKIEFLMWSLFTKMVSALSCLWYNATGHGTDYMFDAIVSADAFKNLKPAPEIFLAALQILDVPISEFIVIEDALAGVQAAKATKMRFLNLGNLNYGFLREKGIKFLFLGEEEGFIERKIGEKGQSEVIRGSCSDSSLEGLCNIPYFF
ncbi:Beta-phosphoglucomutase [Capsicum chinense]|nr:Beta-phosphoglucomutase [Capsicum chinense]